MEELLYEVRDGIGFATLNRPQARNALTFPMYERLAALCGEIASDPGVRALVVTGAGEKAFAAGTDISQFRDFRTAEDALAYEARVDRVLTAVEECPKPTVAAIAALSDSLASAIGRWATRSHPATTSGGSPVRSAPTTSVAASSGPRSGSNSTPD